MIDTVLLSQVRQHMVTSAAACETNQPTKTERHISVDAACRCNKNFHRDVEEGQKLAMCDTKCGQISKHKAGRKARAAAS